MSRQLSQLFGLVRAPDSDLGIVTGAGPRVPVGGEGDGPDRPFMAVHPPGLPRLFEVPQAHGRVSTSRNEPSAVRGECNRENGTVMARQSIQQLTRGRLPQPDRPVVSGTGERPAVARESE